MQGVLVLHYPVPRQSTALATLNGINVFFNELGCRRSRCAQLLFKRRRSEASGCALNLVIVFRNIIIPELALMEPRSHRSSHDWNQPSG
jgi:hypothetical protein